MRQSSEWIRCGDSSWEVRIAFDRVRRSRGWLLLHHLTCTFPERHRQGEKERAREEGKEKQKIFTSSMPNLGDPQCDQTETVLQVTNLYVQRHHDLQWETNISRSHCIIVHINCIWSLAKQTLLNIILSTTCDKWKNKERSFPPPQTTSPRDTGRSGHE